MGPEDRQYRHLKQSRLIDLGAAELSDRIDWKQGRGARPFRARLRVVLESNGRLSAPSVFGRGTR